MPTGVGLTAPEVGFWSFPTALTQENVFVEAPLTKYSKKIFKSLIGLGNEERAGSKLCRAGLPCPKTPPAAASAGAVPAAPPGILWGSPLGCGVAEPEWALWLLGWRWCLCKRREPGKAGSRVAETGLELGKQTQASR